MKLVNKPEMELDYTDIDNLFLDPLNPRVGRHNLGPDVHQDEILKMVEDWTLDELAYSYLENGGFWTHEALLVVEEELYGIPRLVVVEGNRRLAALKLLRDAYEGKGSKKWISISQTASPPPNLFDEVPYILKDSREEIQAFLGFRHVTGIKQWDADEKAYFIANLIDNHGMSYIEVMRMIGSTTPSVRRLYIGFRVLIQIEENVDDYNRDRSEESFAILYMTIDTRGAQTFLNIDMERNPKENKFPIPDTHLDNLKEFALWLYGNKDKTKEPVITNTSQVHKLGRALSEEVSIDYLRLSEKPDIDDAYQLAGGEEEEIIRSIKEARIKVERVLSRVQYFEDSPRIHEQVEDLSISTLTLLSRFSEIKEKMLERFCK